MQALCLTAMLGCNASTGSRCCKEGSTSRFPVTECPMHHPWFSKRDGCTSPTRMESGGASGESLAARAACWLQCDRDCRLAPPPVLRRWAVLSTASFAYYSKPDQAEVKGLFNLADVSFTPGWALHNRKAPTPHVFSVHTPGRVYYFAVANDEEVFRWGRAFDEVRHSALADMSHAASQPFDEDGGATGGGYSQQLAPAPPARHGMHESKRSDTPPPPPPAGAMAEKAIVYVMHRGGGVGGSDARVTLKLNPSKLPTTRVIALKKALARKVDVAPADISLFRDEAAAAAKSPLADTATCGECGMQSHTTQLIMLIAGQQQDTTPTTSMAVAEPPAPAPTGPVPVAVRIARRMVLQRVFGAVPGASGAGGNLTGMVKRGDLLHAMEGDEELSRWGGAAGLYARIEAPPANAQQGGGSDPKLVSWAEVCDALAAENRSISAPSDAAAMAVAPLAAQQQLEAASTGGSASAAGGSLRGRHEYGQDSAPPSPFGSPAPSVSGSVMREAESAPTEALVATGSGTLGVDRQALEASLAAPHEHDFGTARVLLTVDLSESVGGEISVGVHDSAEAVATAFLQEHAPGSDDSLKSALCTEVLHALAEVHGAESSGLQEALKQSNEHLMLAQSSLVAVLRASRALVSAAAAQGVALPPTDELASLPEGAGMRASADLAQRVAAKLLGESSSPKAAAGRDSAASGPSADSSAVVANLRHELAAARVELREMQFQVQTAEAETAEARAAATDALHNSGTNSAVLTREEWRAWAREKRELIAAANADRAALTQELNRLRDSLRLTPGAEGTEAKLRALDDDRARLNAANARLQAQSDTLQHEVRQLQDQWQAEQSEWNTERARLTQQLSDVAGVAVAGGGTAIALGPSSAIVPASRRELEDSAAELAGVQAAHKSALKNWAEETEVLTQMWKSDKAAWAAERATMKRQREAVEGTLGNAPQGHSVPAVSPMGKY